MTQKEFAKKPDYEYAKMAQEIANQITIRTYDEVGSHDVTRATTQPEREIIERLAFAAMISYGHRSDCKVESVLDVAEFALHRFIPEANSYDTLYIPLKTVMGLYD